MNLFDTVDDPKVYNKTRLKKSVKAVFIGRGSPYGNPFRVGVHGSRDDVCGMFETLILPTLDVEPLRGKNLICYCAPLRCHGDSILKKLKATESSKDCGH